MSRHTAFRPDSLAREIALRGLSIDDFATRVGVDRETIARAIKGRPLRATTFRDIVTVLENVPLLKVPDGLIEETA